MREIKNIIKLIILFGVLMTFYIFFYFIFFFVLGESSYEFIIAFCFLFLIYILYKNFSVYIYNILWSLSKDIWLHLVTLLFILKSINELLLNFNCIYLKFLHYKTFILNSVSTSLNVFWFDLNNNLIKKYFINNVLTQFFNRLTIIEKLNNKIINYEFINFYNRKKIDIFGTYFILFFFKNK
jgi:hypothetical protein